MHQFVMVATIGRPNIEKSTLFNHIVGSRQATLARADRGAYGHTTSYNERHTVRIFVKNERVLF
jgi:predicted GTPase